MLETVADVQSSRRIFAQRKSATSFVYLDLVFGASSMVSGSVLRVAAPDDSGREALVLDSRAISGNHDGETVHLSGNAVAVLGSNGLEFRCASPTGTPAVDRWIPVTEQFVETCVEQLTQLAKANRDLATLEDQHRTEIVAANAAVEAANDEIRRLERAVQPGVWHSRSSFNASAAVSGKYVPTGCLEDVRERCQDAKDRLASLTATELYYKRESEKPYGWFARLKGEDAAVKAELQQFTNKRIESEQHYAELQKTLAATESQRLKDAESLSLKRATMPVLEAQRDAQLTAIQAKYAPRIAAVEQRLKSLHLPEDQLPPAGPTLKQLMPASAYTLRSGF